MTQFLRYDCTFKKQCTVHVTLTFDLWRSIFFMWIEYNPRSIKYKFQINVSSNSREIKYQNIGRTHTHRQTTHTHRQTDRVKTIPRNPLQGRGNKLLATHVKNGWVNNSMLRWQAPHNWGKKTWEVALLGWKCVTWDFQDSVRTPPPPHTHTHTNIPLSQGSIYYRSCEVYIYSSQYAPTSY